MSSNHDDAAAFQDTSTECGICLAPFDEITETIITLPGCGHKWHLECLKDQLMHAQPSPAKRLVFTGCRCAKCGVVCDHEALRHLTRKVDTLRTQVDTLIREQLGLVGNDEGMLEHGRRTFAYYQCSFCKDPYFGGTIECADIATDELEERTDRLCPKCSPKAQLKCLDPASHRASLVWKCRFCCNIATHVCYGSIHFCSSCHDRNSQRVRQQGERSSYISSVSCTEDACPFPFPEGCSSHQNGPEASCEQVYYCARCDSRESHRQPEVPERTPNLLRNPSGNEGLRYWSRYPNSPPFAVERSDIPVNAARTNFVSSFRWCAMTQMVDLRDVDERGASGSVEVSAKFMARTDCPSVFHLEGLLLDRDRRPVLHEKSPILEAPADSWETARLVLERQQRAVYAMIVIAGKDSRFWQGHYGSKVADCSIRILEPTTEESSSETTNNHDEPIRQARGQERREREIRNDEVPADARGNQGRVGTEVLILIVLLVALILGGGA